MCASNRYLWNGEWLILMRFDAADVRLAGLLVKLRVYIRSGCFWCVVMPVLSRAGVCESSIYGL